MTATPGERIGGWLIAPLAWLLVALLSASLALLLYTTALITPHAIQTLLSQSVLNIALWFVSFVFAIGMWYYTLWLTIAFFKRRKNVPNALHYLAAGFGPAGGEGVCLFRPFQTRWPFVSCFSRCWPRRCWCPTSSVRRG